MAGGSSNGLRGIALQATVPWLCSTALALSSALAPAAAPVFDGFFPAGGKQGSSFTLVASGKLDPDVRIWTDCPGLSILPTAKKGEWQATVLPDAPVGLHLVRAWNAEGASEVRWFSIGALPESAEVEPNDEASKGQNLEKLPVTINGRFDKGGDVDGYAVTLAAGQTLVGQVEAYALGSPVDVMAHVVDDQGLRVLTASDARNLDPVIVFKAAKAGRYTVQLAAFAHPPTASVAFTGGKTAIYRLHLSTGPVVTEVIPAVVQSKGKTEVGLGGYNLGEKPVRHSLQPQPILPGAEVLSVAVPNALTALQVVVADKPAVLEKEPNNEPAKANPLKLSEPVAGTIQEKDALDRYALQVKKGERVSLRIYASRLGSPLDAVLQVMDAQGKELANVDDSGGVSDAQSEWKAPADGTYQITVQDRFQRGGERFTYVLKAELSAPAFEVLLADGKSPVLEAGKSASIKATVKRLNGSKEPLVIRLAGLPAGVHAPDVEVPEKGGEVEIKLQAAENLVAAQGPVQVTAWTKSDPSQVRVAAFPLRGESLRGTSLRDWGHSLWLTTRGK